MWVASALHKAGKNEHPGPGGGPKVAHIIAPRCQLGMDIHVLHPPTRCPHGAALLPCVTARCYCSTATFHDVSTTPKVASAVNVPPMPGPVTPARV